MNVILRNISPPPGGRLLLDGANLVSWMRRL
jgi:hypothetical protein